MILRDTMRGLGGAFLLATAAAAAGLALTAPAAAMQLGGWRAASTSDAGVQAAASFAAGELGGSLNSVDSAQTQSAAGTNYRLVITLEDGAVWQVTVHRNLQGEHNLQSSAQQSGSSSEDETDTGTNDGSDDE